MSKKALKGIVKELSNKDYHDNKTHMSSSVLKEAIRDPQEYKRIYVDKGLKEDKPNNSLLLGTYVHTMLLEPELLEKECAVYPANARRGKSWEFFRDTNKGKTIITQPQYTVAEEILNSAKSTAIVNEEGEFKAIDLVKEGEHELSLFIDLEFPLNKANKELVEKKELLDKKKVKYNVAKIKVRADQLVKKDDKLIIRDVKTTFKCPNDTKEAKNICYDWYYFLSGALYLDAFTQHYGVEEGVFEFLFFSTTDYKTNHYRMSKQSLAYGRKQYVYALNSILYWKLTGNYPVSLVKEI